MDAGQEIPYLLWNLKVYYHRNKILPWDHTLSQMNSAHIRAQTVFLRLL
jgi:hypothetical protein